MTLRGVCKPFTTGIKLVESPISRVQPPLNRSGVQGGNVTAVIPMYSCDESTRTSKLGGAVGFKYIQFLDMNQYCKAMHACSLLPWAWQQHGTTCARVHAAAIFPRSLGYKKSRDKTTSFTALQLLTIHVHNHGTEAHNAQPTLIIFLTNVSCYNNMLS